jgi:outer membrane receptor protein involved in Fe transport
VSWRHTDAVTLSSLSDNSFLAGTPSVINKKISAYNYIDLAGTVAVGRGLQLRAGVNNLFDKDPPAIAAGILSSFGNGNTYPGVYDTLGRTMFVGATVNF